MEPPKVRLEPLTDEQMDAEQAEMLSHYRVDGEIFNVFRVFVRDFPMFKRHQVFANYIMRKSHLPPRDRELAILRIGWLNKSEYEWAHHAYMGVEAGLSEEEVKRVCAGPDAAGWSDWDATLLRAVDQIKFDAQMTDEIYNKLADTYDDKQMIDLVMTVGNYNMVSTGLNIFGVQLEDHVPGFPDDLVVEG